ncbi:gluzincin family metallopeptidase [Spiroplasma culicicola]|uniref:Oligoendopeptidase F n=1 Tax=Spiroplasma culicicola AES-1 TaxID=1276246 RepID=W6A767_9MOLU|nr:M3 family metallopeptidase [Spiroplasma culicicola]AHI52837.1 oligoendopeptidase F [Spiroplasma culicicola AES-1]
MQNQEIEKKYKWKLEFSFKSKKHFIKKLNKIIKMNMKLLKFEDKFNDFQVFKKFFFKNRKVNKLEEQLAYPFNLLEVEQNNDYLLELNQIYNIKMNDISDKFTWVQENLKNYNKDQFLEFVKNDNDLKNYYKSYVDFYKEIKYLLPEKDRKILAKTNGSSSTIYEMYETLMYKDYKTSKFIFQNQEYKLDNKTYTQILTDSNPIKDQKLRIEYSQAFNKNIFNKRFSFIKLYDALIRENVESYKLIGIKDYFEYFFDDSDFYKPDLETIINATSKYEYLVEKFYLLFKEHFNFDNEFYITDTSLKLSKENNQKITIEKGIEVIKSAFDIFGDEYGQFLEEMLIPGKIDYLEYKYKNSGAFTITNNYFKPLISLNWTNDISSIMTLGHELGHGIHHLYAQKYQPEPFNSFGHLIGEVASTFNELIIMQYLLKTASKETKIWLIQNKIEFLMSNLFSAIKFTKFELNCFEQVHNDKIINELYLDQLIKELNQNSSIQYFDKEFKKYSWINIDHIFEQPFYLYKYSVSISVAFHFFNNFLKTGDITPFIEFLKEGGNLEPKQLFKKYGFDTLNEHSYDSIFQYIDKLIEQLRELIK